MTITKQIKMATKKFEVQIINSDGVFQCPRCFALTNNADDDHGVEEIQIEDQRFIKVTCRGCKKASLYCIYSKMVAVTATSSTRMYREKWVHPKHGLYPEPSQDMPVRVKEFYEEASTIFDLSPRGGTALLRLALQELLHGFEIKEKNLNAAIGELAKRTNFNDSIVAAADTIRITGNNAVHPGELNDEDIDGIGAKLFDLLNYLVRQGLTEPAEIEKLFSSVPEKARKDAKKRDEKNRKSK